MHIMISCRNWTNMSNYILLLSYESVSELPHDDWYKHLAEASLSLSPVWDMSLYKLKYLWTVQITYIIYINRIFLYIKIDFTWFKKILQKKNVYDVE